VTGASASSLEEAARAKEAVRERIWALMERKRVPCFPGATGRIPNFAGGPVAAACLASLPEWRAARVVRANPDAPQLSVRARALAVGALALAVVAGAPHQWATPQSRRLDAGHPRGRRARGRPRYRRVTQERRPAAGPTCGITMLGAWAAWMAAVAPSSADATPPATSAAACWWPARAATRLAGLPGSAPASSARRRLS
jgi:hypothetical protein